MKNANEWRVNYVPLAKLNSESKSIEEELSQTLDEALYDVGQLTLNQMPENVFRVVKRLHTISGVVATRYLSNKKANS